MAVQSLTADVIELALMRRRHLRQVLKIERLVYPRPWGHSVFMNELQAPADQRFYIVARFGGRVVGYGGLMASLDASDGSRSAHVTNIAVDPSLRRMKLGTCLLIELFQKAHEWRSVSVTLEVRHTNVAAQELYHRFGFLQEGVRKRYYENTDDAYVMWARNIDQPAFFDRLETLAAESPGATWLPS